MSNNKTLDHTTLKDIIAAQITATVCFLFELFFCLSFFYNKISLVSLLIIHLLILLAITAIMLIINRLKISIKMFVFILIETAIAGPLGSFTSIISLIFYMLLIGEKTQLEKKLEFLHPKHERSLSDKIYNSVRWDLPSEEISTEPFTDIIKYGTIIEKQKVLIKIKKYFKPEFTPLLFEAVNDADNSIRVQAAAIIANIEENFMEQYKKLEEKLENEEFSYKLIIDFFELCLAYSKTEILNLEKKSDFIYKQIEKIAKHINTGKIKDELKMIEIKVFISKALLLINRNIEAFDIFISINHNTDLFFKNTDAVKTYLTAAFICRRFSTIREFINRNNERIRANINNDYELLRLINTWQEIEYEA